MKLYGVEARLVGAARAGGEVVDDAVALFVGQFVRFPAYAVNRMRDLQADLAAFVMHGGDKFFKTVDMPVAADLQTQPRVDEVRADARMLGHDQADAGTGAVHIMLDGILRDKPSGSRRVGKHRRHDDPVAQFHRIYFDRCKKADSLHVKILLSESVYKKAAADSRFSFPPQTSIPDNIYDLFFRGGLARRDLLRSDPHGVVELQIAGAAAEVAR